MTEMVANVLTTEMFAPATTTSVLPTGTLSGVNGFIDQITHLLQDPTVKMLIDKFVKRHDGINAPVTIVNPTAGAMPPAPPIPQSTYTAEDVYNKIMGGINGMISMGKGELTLMQLKSQLEQPSEKQGLIELLKKLEGLK